MAVEFTVKGKVHMRINNKSRESKSGKPYSFDYMVIAEDRSTWQGDTTDYFPIELMNDNKSTPFKKEIEVGDMIECLCEMESELWGDKKVEIREYEQKGGHIQKSPSGLFPKIKLIEVKGHVKGVVADNMGFGQTLDDNPLPEPPGEDDLPF